MQLLVYYSVDDRSKLNDDFLVNRYLEKYLREFPQCTMHHDDVEYWIVRDSLNSPVLLSNELVNDELMSPEQRDDPTKNNHHKKFSVLDILLLMWL